MGWTYQEYLEQPMPFIDNLLEMLRAESTEQAKRVKSGG